MKPELHALMVEAARRVLQEPDLGRSTDPHRLAWAKQVVAIADAPKPQPEPKQETA